MAEALRRDRWLLALNALAALLCVWAIWDFFHVISFANRSSAEDVGDGVAWLLRFFAPVIAAFMLDFLWAVTRGSSLRLHKSSLVVLAGGWLLMLLGVWTTFHFYRAG